MDSDNTKFIDSLYFFQSIEHNHSRAFYTLLEVLQPDWRRLREELNQLDIA